MQPAVTMKNLRQSFSMKPTMKGMRRISTKLLRPEGGDGRYGDLEDSCQLLNEMIMDDDMSKDSSTVCSTSSHQHEDGPHGGESCIPEFVSPKAGSFAQFTPLHEDDSHAAGSAAADSKSCSSIPEFISPEEGTFAQFTPEDLSSVTTPSSSIIAPLAAEPSASTKKKLKKEKSSRGTLTKKKSEKGTKKKKSSSSSKKAWSIPRTDDSDDNVHEMINRARKLFGYKPLQFSPELDAMATEHASNMADKQHLYLPKRNGKYAAQNVQVGPSVAEMHAELLRNGTSGWANVTDKKFTEMGCANVTGSDGQVYLCQLFR